MTTKRSCRKRPSCSMSQPRAACVASPSKPTRPAQQPRKPAVSGKSAAARPHFSRPATHSRDRKPAQSSSGSRPARRAGADSRPATVRARAAANVLRLALAGVPSQPRAQRRNATEAMLALPQATETASKGTARPAARPANGASGVALSEIRRAILGPAQWPSQRQPGAGKTGSIARKQASPRELAPSRNGNGSRKPALGRRRKGWKQQAVRLYRPAQAGDEEARMSADESSVRSLDPSRKIIVAIDGPAGAGKSTIARHLARHFGLLNLETGAMYRAFALKALRRRLFGR